MLREPSVSAGRINTNPPPYPLGGNHFSVSANSRINSSPTQNTGKLMPRYVAPISTLSNAPAGFSAAMTPMPMPSRIAIDIAANASCAVLGKRSRISCMIGRPVI